MFETPGTLKYVWSSRVVVKPRQGFHTTTINNQPAPCGWVALPPAGCPAAGDAPHEGLLKPGHEYGGPAEGWSRGRGKGPSSSGFSGRKQTQNKMKSEKSEDKAKEKTGKRERNYRANTISSTLANSPKSNCLNDLTKIEHPPLGPSRNFKCLVLPRDPCATL